MFPPILNRTVKNINEASHCNRLKSIGILSCKRRSRERSDMARTVIIIIIIIYGKRKDGAYRPFGLVRHER